MRFSIFVLICFTVLSCCFMKSSTSNNGFPSNILHEIDFNQYNTQTFKLMDKVDSKDLSQRIRKNSIDLPILGNIYDNKSKNLRIEGKKLDKDALIKSYGMFIQDGKIADFELEPIIMPMLTTRK